MEKENIMNRVRSLRAGLGLNQKQMAEKLGISVVTYCRKEQGLAEWKPTEMTKIVEIANELTEANNYNVKDIFF